MYRIGQVGRQIDVESLGEYGQLFFRVDGFHSGNDRNGDAHLPATLHEVMEFLIVEEHLCDDVVGTQLHFFLQVLHVGIHVGRLEMFFRVAGHTDTESGFVRFTQVFFQVDPVVQIDHLFEQVGCVFMSPRFGLKTHFIFRRISTEY